MPASAESSSTMPVDITPPIAVVAMGGHAFIKPGEVGTASEHAANARAVCRELVTLVERGYHLVITHGNGPQVGAQLLRDELARDRVPQQPLDVLVAQTAGSLGYYLQRAMINELRLRAIDRFVVTMISQVVVNPDDPALLAPSKPVGPAYEQAIAEAARDEYGWVIGEDKGRGWRRLVPSPVPQQILQRETIRAAAQAGNIVITAGGGGIPVMISRDGSDDLVGIEAVIDKDATSGVLATDVGAELLVILTPVDGVYLDFGEPTARRLGAVTMAESERYIADGHFPLGSMGPKVTSVHGFLQRGGRRGLVTNADNLRDALDGKAGTHFIGRL